MWRIENPEIKHAKLNFSLSGQASPEVSQLFCGGTKLINALELVDWDDEETQFLICETCGNVGCNPGDWVSLRTAGPLILILPAFDALRADENKNAEYEPPWYIRDRGIPYFDRPTYDLLRTLHPAFPSIKSIRGLRGREAMLALQWDSPALVLGEPPRPAICRRDLIVGSSEPDDDEQIERLEQLVQTGVNNDSLVELRPPRSHERVVSLYLDTTEFFEWKVLACDQGKWCLMLNSEYVIDYQTNS